MNLNVKLSIDEIDVLREAHKFFWVDTGEVLSGTQLVVWAAKMVIAAYDDQAK
jgi:hypothetical protein